MESRRARCCLLQRTLTSVNPDSRSCDAQTALRSSIFALATCYSTLQHLHLRLPQHHPNFGYTRGQATAEWRWRHPQARSSVPVSAPSSRVACQRTRPCGGIYSERARTLRTARPTRRVLAVDADRRLCAGGAGYAAGIAMGVLRRQMQARGGVGRRHLAG